VSRQQDVYVKCVKECSYHSIYLILSDLISCDLISSDLTVLQLVVVNWVMKQPSFCGCSQS